MAQFQADNGNLICQKVFAFGLDFFNPQTTVKDALHIQDLNEDKLQNIATCERKRLYRFANEFPHEQHLLNLQSLLVACLVNLTRLVASQTTTLTELLQQLARIAVLVNEVDSEVAKAKLRKRNEFASYQQVVKETDEAIKLAADKSKENRDDTRAANRAARLYAEQQAELKAQADKLLQQAEKIKQVMDFIKARAGQATQKLLPQYYLSLRLGLSNRIELVESRLKQIISQMRINNQSLELKIFEAALVQLKARP